MFISVVIPTLDEQKHIQHSVQSCWSAGADEVIVCDGGSRDQTIRIATESGATIVRDRPGRGIQLNAGAKRATGDVLLFLHADNWLDRQAIQQIRQVLSESSCSWGGFKQKIDNRSGIYRLIEFGNSYRLRLRMMAFGDQGIFVKRDLFEQVGGFEPIRLMEDVRLSVALNNIVRPVLLPGPIHVAARRWENHGPIRTTLNNWNLVRRFRSGTPVDLLADEYYGKAARVTSISTLLKSKA